MFLFKSVPLSFCLHNPISVEYHGCFQGGWGVMVTNHLLLTFLENIAIIYTQTPQLM
jgi:hypothetical protein